MHSQQQQHWSILVEQWEEVPSVARQRVTARVAACEPRGRSAGLLSFFVGHDWEQQVSLPLTTEPGTKDATLEPPSSSVLVPVLQCWWFAPDETKDTGVSWALQGTGSAYYSSLDAVDTGESFSVYLYDLTGYRVGSVTLRLQQKPAQETAWQEYQQRCTLADRQLEAYLETADTLFWNSGKGSQQQRAVIEDNLPVWTSSSVKMGVRNGVVGWYVPMWGFLWGAMFDPPPSDTLLESLLEEARQRLRCCVITPDQQEAYALETLCEAAALLPLSCAYRLDHQGDRSMADQWASPFWSPVLPKMGIDCEDGAEAVIRLLRCLRDHTEIGKRILSTERYELMFSIVTLEVEPGQYSYHAVVMGVDAAWFQQHVNSSTTTPTAQSQQPRNPMFIVETTAYTTAVTGLTGVPSHTASAWTPRSENVHYKIAPSDIEQSHKYRTALTAFNPEWIARYGFAEIGFCDRSNQSDSAVTGVKVSQIRSYDDSIVFMRGPPVDSALTTAFEQVIAPSFPAPHWPSTAALRFIKRPPARKLYYVRRYGEAIQEHLSEAQQHDHNIISHDIVLSQTTEFALLS